MMHHRGIPISNHQVGAGLLSEHKGKVLATHKGGGRINHILLSVSIYCYLGGKGSLLGGIDEYSPGLTLPDLVGTAIALCLGLGNLTDTTQHQLPILGNHIAYRET